MTRNTHKISPAARLLNKNPDSLRRWDNSGLFPARRDRNGHRIYTESDIAEMRELAATLKPGRPPKRKPEGGV